MKSLLCLADLGYMDWYLSIGDPHPALLIPVAIPPKLLALLTPLVVSPVGFVEDAPRELRALRRVCPVFTVGWPYNGSNLGWSGVERDLRTLLSGCIMEVKVGERDARDRHAEAPGR